MGRVFWAICLVATDMGEPAPEEIMQKRDRVNSLVFAPLLTPPLFLTKIRTLDPP